MLLICEIMQLLSSLVLIALVLLHSAKGEGIASVGSSAQMFRSSSNLEKGLNITTWIFGFMFLLSSLLISWGVVG